MLPISQSVRHGRRFLRNLTFSVPAVAILALGLGANVAIFAVAYAVLLRPLPFTDQNALVIMWERDERRNQPLTRPGDPVRRRTSRAGRGSVRRAASVDPLIALKED